MTTEEINGLLPRIVRSRVPCTIEFQVDGTVRVEVGPYRTGPAKQTITKRFDEAVRWLHDQVARHTEAKQQ